MKRAEDLLREGQLKSAIEVASGNVKANPTDVSVRIFLFELLSFAGDLDRALKQLDVIAHQSTEMETGVRVYRQLLSAERARRNVFKGSEPDFLMTPPSYTVHYIDALKLRTEGKPSGSREALEKGISLRHELSGVADGNDFADLEDADVLIAPFLELFLGERYIWLPYEQIQTIEMHKPVNLRDLLWRRAKLETRGGDLGEVFVPVIYPETIDEANDLLSLGRRTDWVDVGEGLTRGVGQRMLLIDEIDHAILQINSLRFG